MEEIEFSLEKRLRELRRSHQLSQEELAEALGISRQSIIALEQGKYLPSLPIAASICRFFDMAFEEVFGMEEEEEDQPMRIKVIKGNDDLPRKENTMIGDIEPWKPFREAVSLRDAVDRLLSDSFITPRSASLMPRIDVKERKEDFLVKAELPGLKEEEIDIEVTSDGIVTISGEKREEKEEKEEDKGYYYQESYAGTFSRSISLPTDVVADKAVADMENGVLTLMIPKAQPEKTQKIKISAKK